MPEHSFSRLSNCLYGDFAEVEQPVVVRAQHSDVFQRVVPAVLPGFNVRDVAGGFAPAADAAAVVELSADCVPEAVHRTVRAVRWPTSGHDLTVTDSFADAVTVDVSFTISPLRRQVMNGFAAGRARGNGPAFAWPRRVLFLPCELALIAAELGLLTFLLAFAPGQAGAAGQAVLLIIVVCVLDTALLRAVFSTGAFRYSWSPGDGAAASGTGLAGDELRHDLSIQGGRLHERLVN